jgi:hypothetical protein
MKCFGIIYYNNGIIYLGWEHKEKKEKKREVVIPKAILRKYNKLLFIKE